jgi:Serine dehydrogenase proteinase
MPSTEDLSLIPIPSTYQELFNLFTALKEFSPFVLRERTFKNIESLTGRPLISFVAKTSNVPQGIPVAIDDSDLLGFGDLVSSIQGDSVDVFLVSNGGSAEAAERIVRLLRERFSEIRFIVPANAYSAATLICLSGDEIIMDAVGTLGPIDPQINGIPARAILRAFEQLEERLKSEGPRALTAYMPLISKYDLHILEICKSAQDLSEELARTWLSAYMLKCSEADETVDRVVKFLSDYDIHKSHGRSVGLTKARELGLKVKSVTEVDGLAPLVRSLFNQYALWFDSTSFYKMYENAHGINWGRQIQFIVPQSPSAAPQVNAPGPPVRSN